jgi:hypothetical protein
MFVLDLHLFSTCTFFADRLVSNLSFASTVYPNDNALETGDSRRANNSPSTAGFSTTRTPVFGLAISKVGLGHLHFARVLPLYREDRHTVSTFSLSLLPGDGSSSTNAITTWEGT